MSKRRYRIRYTDADDPGCPVFSQTVTAHSKEHAEEKFFSSGDSDGWKIVSIEVVDSKRNPGSGKRKMLVGRGLHLVIGKRLTYTTLHEMLDELPRRGTRPLRAPHHTVGMAGMFGETRGEYWLANGGVLYMEEAADFLPSVLRKVFELGAQTTIGETGPAIIILQVDELGPGEKRRFERTDAFSHIDKTFENP